MQALSTAFGSATSGLSGMASGLAGALSQENAVKEAPAASVPAWTHHTAPLFTVAIAARTLPKQQTALSDGCAAQGWSCVWVPSLLPTLRAMGLPPSTPSTAPRAVNALYAATEATTKSCAQALNQPALVVSLEPVGGAVYDLVVAGLESAGEWGEDAELVDAVGDDEAVVAAVLGFVSDKDPVEPAPQEVGEKAGQEDGKAGEEDGKAGQEEVEGKVGQEDGKAGQEDGKAGEEDGKKADGKTGQEEEDGKVEQEEGNAKAQDEAKRPEGEVAGNPEEQQQPNGEAK